MRLLCKCGIHSWFIISREVKVKDKSEARELVNRLTSGKYDVYSEEVMDVVKSDTYKSNKKFLGFRRFCTRCFFVDALKFVSIDDVVKTDDQHFVKSYASISKEELVNDFPLYGNKVSEAKRSLLSIIDEEEMPNVLKEKINNIHNML